MALVEARKRKRAPLHMGGGWSDERASAQAVARESRALVFLQGNPDERKPKMD